MKWKTALLREALTSERLDAMAPGEAAAYFVSRQAEGLTQSEETLLEAWLAADEANVRELDRAKRAWDCFAGTEDDELLLAMRKHALESRPLAQQTWIRAVAAAAMIAVFVGLSFLVLPNITSGPGLEGPQGAAIQYASARTQVREFRLPDGSAMTLDADSVAVGRMDDDRRTIQLVRGRAFFAVAPDPRRRFEVLAKGQRVTAIATRFDVSTLGDALTVTLLEGRVTVGPTGSREVVATLDPGQQFVLRGGRGLIRELGAKSNTEAGWRQGLANFDDQSLAEAARVVNRYSDAQVVIQDPAVAELRISGQFRTGDASRFAQTVAELHGLRAVRTGDRIELRR